MKKFNQMEFIGDILKLSPRQGRNEQKTAQFLLSFLKKNTIAFTLQNFTTEIPLSTMEKLVVDGKKIACKNTSFVSGKVNRNNLISSLTSSQIFPQISNINFNPLCQTISLSNFYFAPSMAIDRSNVTRIINAKKVEAVVKTKKVIFESANILVGNTRDPKNIYIAHYDSIETGATDNASGVSVVMALALSEPTLLKDNLYVFSGNEELSYDEPVYWGRGFRVFETKYLSLMRKAQAIYIVDCVGNGKTVIEQDKAIMKLAFPIKNLKSLEDKIYTVSGNIKKLMKVYHSGNDTIAQLKEIYLKECLSKLKSLPLDSGSYNQVGSGK